MWTIFASFLSDEDGAITVDWVALVAILVSLILFAIPLVRPATIAAASSLNADVLKVLTFN